MYGATDVTWCGDNGWITYASSNCYGESGFYPTYRYEGCSLDEDYGVGWNVYEVWTQHHFCVWYEPLSGLCFAEEDPIAEYQFYGDGGVAYVGGS